MYIKNKFIELIEIEKFSKKILENYFQARIFHLTPENPTSPHDLEFEGKRIDVKYSNPVRIRSGENYLFWDFDLRGKKNYCEYLALLTMINNEPKKLLLIPCIDLPAHHIRIAIKGWSKWNEFIIWND